MNKDLYGKYFDIDSTVLNDLEKFRGEKTIDNLLDKKKVSYSGLKRIKNRMEMGEMEELGGQNFKNWVDQKLGSERRDIHISKEEIGRAHV